MNPTEEPYTLAVTSVETTALLAETAAPRSYFVTLKGTFLVVRIERLNYLWASMAYVSVCSRYLVFFNMVLNLCV